MKILLWSGRAIAALVTFGWLLITFLGAINPEKEPWTIESTMLLTMIVIAVLVTLLAWRNEKTGAIALILFGLAFSAFGYVSAGHNKWLAVLSSGAPFLMAGALMAAAWMLEKRMSVRDQAPSPKT